MTQTAQMTSKPDLLYGTMKNQPFIIVIVGKYRQTQRILHGGWVVYLHPFFFFDRHCRVPYT